jgi:hypothetical protein
LEEEIKKTDVQKEEEEENEKQRQQYDKKGKLFWGNLFFSWRGTVSPAPLSTEVREEAAGV